MLPRPDNPRASRPLALSFGRIAVRCGHAVVACLLPLWCLSGQAAAADADGDLTFETAIRPLLESKCFACHGENVRKKKLDLRTKASMLRGSRSGPVLVPGAPEKSRLWDMVRQRKMPPGRNDRLTDAEIALIERWILQGAPAIEQPAADAGSDRQSDEEQLSLWPLKKLERPPVPGSNSSENPIDAFLRARLSQEGLAFAPQAGKITLIRRAFVDLTGLPPSPEEVDEFLQDTSPNAFPRLVDRLLDSPRYGERWGRHWLDVARYADTGGYETDIFYRKAWRYRDYVIRSFNEDKPYDRFVQEQIAGDELWPDNLDMDGSYNIPREKLEHLTARVGTGFYALGPQIHESNMDATKLAYERLTDWADATGSAFLGLTIGCARCHDHKFDPITQIDYYRLQAIFAPSVTVEIPVINPMAIASYHQHYPKLIAVDEAKRAYRAFEAETAGRQLSEAEQQRKRRLIERLAQTVLELPEGAAENEGGEQYDGLFEIPAAAVLSHARPELFRPVRLLERGELRRPRQEIAPGLPPVLADAAGDPVSFDNPREYRKQLALWITRPDHPLTARVMVNRIWQWHFGAGIAATPNDFGALGEPPTHPELLDWLATEFVARGWSIKQMHRLIMSSQTYQMSSRFTHPDNLEQDPENRLLWRMSRRRLEAEALWDALHAVAGTLNLKMGGRPVVPPLADDELAALREEWQWPVSGNPADHNRRGVYILVRRNFRFPMFEAFDGPVNAVSCACRDVTTVAPQALWFMNNQVVYRQAQEFAGRIVKEAGSEPIDWIDRGWRIALSRPPTELETEEALAQLEAVEKLEKSGPSDRGPEQPIPAALAPLGEARSEALTTLCLTILNLNEFTFID